MSNVGVATESPTEAMTPFGAAAAEVKLSSLSVELGPEQPTEPEPSTCASSGCQASYSRHGICPTRSGGRNTAEPVAEPVVEPAVDRRQNLSAATPSQPRLPLKSPVVSLAMRFTEVERAVGVLRRRYAAGGMTRDQLKEELRKLMILDENEQWWMIGLETDRWYKYDGKDWVLATPPGRPVVQEAPAQASTGTAGFSFTTELTEPLPQRVPLQDEGATMVGSWASRLESEVKSGGAPLTAD